MWRYEILAALAVGAAVIAIAENVEAKDKYGANRSQTSNKKNSSWSKNSYSNSLSRKSTPYAVIDPGMGGGHGNHHQQQQQGHHHHGHHDYGHHRHSVYPWVVGYSQPLPVVVPVPLPTPIVPTILPGGANLVDGVNLVLIDVRMVDGGDATRNLGPRYRVVVGNRGKQAAGNFQVAMMAANSTELTPDLPHSVVEVEGIAAGQIAKIDLRLPIGAMSMNSGGPFRWLALTADVNQLLEETAEQDNSRMIERTKIEMLGR